MIGFGAGVGQMSAIFGLQPCCNEVAGGESSRGRTEPLLLVCAVVRSSSITAGLVSTTGLSAGPLVAVASLLGSIYSL